MAMEGLLGNDFATDFTLGIKDLDYTPLAAPRDFSNHNWNNSSRDIFHFNYNSRVVP